jgi:hypothetical protein
MRLIDADKIIDSLGNSDMDFAIGAVIDEQPTVFDVFCGIFATLVDVFETLSRSKKVPYTYIRFCPESYACTTHLCSSCNNSGLSKILLTTSISHLSI